MTECDGPGAELLVCLWLAVPVLLVWALILFARAWCQAEEASRD